MKKLTKQEMINIKAGSMSGTLWNAVVRGFSCFTDIGRYAGSALRRIFDKSVCGF